MSRQTVGKRRFRGGQLAVGVLAIVASTTADAAEETNRKRQFMQQYRISTQGSERATQGNGGKLMTRDDKTHVVWQDSIKKGYLNQVATFDRKTERFTETVTLNIGKDNHARPNLLMDHNGYLHAIISGHQSPVTYRRSIKPNDASEWTAPVDIGSGTYPVPALAPDGTLYVLMRGAFRWNGANLYVKPKDGEWRKQCKLVYRDPDMPGYAAFHGGPVAAPDGTLHVVINMYEGKGIMDRRGLHQAICYMKSADNGETWTTADGTPVKLPARPDGMDVIARDRAVERHEDKPPPLFSAGANLALDAQNLPHILYYDHRIAPGQVMHATTNADGEWRRENVHALTDAFPSFRTTAIRNMCILPGTNRIVALAELQPFDKMWHNGLPMREMNMNPKREKRLAWLLSPDGGQTWSARLALDTGNVNCPTFEQPRGGNRLPAHALPPLLYFDGSKDYPEEGEIIQNNVYLVLPAEPTSPRPTASTSTEETVRPGAPYRDKHAWRDALPGKFKDHPAFVWAQPDPILPNVLLLGDSISLGYTNPLRERLTNMANVFRAPQNCRHTRQSLEQIEFYLGLREWDVIHFNWGIHDITRVNTNGNTDAEGKPQVSLEDYRANLQRLVRRLKATGASLVWASTTPVAEDLGYRRNEDIDAYNQAAREIMRQHHIRINDLHALVHAHEQSLWTDGVHFMDEASRLFAEAVAENVVDELAHGLALEPLIRNELIAQPEADGGAHIWTLPLSNPLFPGAVQVSVHPAADNGAGWQIDIDPQESVLERGEALNVRIKASLPPGTPRYPLPEVVLDIAMEETNVSAAIARSTRKTLPITGTQALLAIPQATEQPAPAESLAHELGQRGPDVPVFGRMDGKRSTEPGTQAWTAYDNEALYIAFRCAEPNMDQLKAKATNRDGRLWLDDSVEIMVDPVGDGKTYYQIIANSNGVIFDGRKFDNSVNLESLRVATEAAGDHWIAEIAIPWKALGLDAPPEQAGLLLCRNRHASGKHEVFQFPVSPKGNHQPEFFARVRFK